MLATVAPTAPPPGIAAVVAGMHINHGQQPQPGEHAPKPLQGWRAKASAQGLLPQPEDDSPLYRTDEFRIYCYKVLPCSKRYCHDWTTCPFSHPAEKAKRRDPRVYTYTGVACPEMKKCMSCPRGEQCPYAHNVFEYWLHPSRYRTQLCNDGVGCKRKVCFFAHTLDELRVSSVKVLSPELASRLGAIDTGFDGIAGLDPFAMPGQATVVGVDASNLQHLAQVQAQLQAASSPTMLQSGQRSPQAPSPHESNQVLVEQLAQILGRQQQQPQQQPVTPDFMHLLQQMMQTNQQQQQQAQQQAQQQQQQLAAAAAAVQAQNQLAALQLLGQLNGGGSQGSATAAVAAAEQLRRSSYNSGSMPAARVPVVNAPTMLRSPMPHAPASGIPMAMGGRMVHADQAAAAVGHSMGSMGSPYAGSPVQAPAMGLTDADILAQHFANLRAADAQMMQQGAGYGYSAGSMPAGSISSGSMSPGLVGSHMGGMGMGHMGGVMPGSGHTSQRSSIVLGSHVSPRSMSPLGADPVLNTTSYFSHSPASTDGSDVASHRSDGGSEDGLYGAQQPRRITSPFHL